MSSLDCICTLISLSADRTLCW